MTYELHTGDALATLRTLPSESVHCCVTSIPYWGLRDYGVEGQIGLEPTLDVFLDRIVGVFDEVRRVLRTDGTTWINIGDTYANDTKWGGATSGKHIKALHGDTSIGRGRKSTGLPAKSLIGAPWRVAFALQAAGWTLRSDIIWHKPNPMPEAVTDRPTKAHEYIFLLAKSERYFYDASAIREPVTGEAHPRGHGANPKAAKDEGRDRQGLRPSTRMGRGAGFRAKQNASFSTAITDLVTHRNKRDVWTVQSEPYPAAHFATFPPKLIEPCILAGCPRGGVVIDPFAGSGTTGAVALTHGRSFIGIELNPAYVELAHQRIGAAVERAGLLTPELATKHAATRPVQLGILEKIGGG